MYIAYKYSGIGIDNWIRGHVVTIFNTTNWVIYNRTVSASVLVYYLTDPFYKGIAVIAIHVCFSNILYNHKTNL